MVFGKYDETLSKMPVDGLLMQKSTDKKTGQKKEIRPYIDLNKMADFLEMICPGECKNIHDVLEKMKDKDLMNVFLQSGRLSR